MTQNNEEMSKVIHDVICSKCHTSIYSSVNGCECGGTKNGK